MMEQSKVEKTKQAESDAGSQSLRDANMASGFDGNAGDNDGNDLSKGSFGDQSREAKDGATKQEIQDYQEKVDQQREAQRSSGNEPSG